MTIVLVIILMRMDKFEAKLRREQTNKGQQQVGGRNKKTSIPNADTDESGKTAQRAPQGCSLTISMKYRRRIVKILFTYLLTSIVCWTPLQFTIVYRHFRSEAIPSPWFFELAFFAQLSASFTAAMNPIIFGFLSQPFRRMVTKSLMFRFLDKILATNNQNPPNNQQQNQNYPNQQHHGLDGRPAGKSVERQQRTSHHAASTRGNPRSGRSKSRRPVPTASRQLASSQQNSNALQHQASAAGKRVSFNMPLGEGRDNLAYEAASGSRSIVPEQRRGAAHLAMTTTSFINHQRSTAIRPLSIISMDSINIEENLATDPRLRYELESFSRRSQMENGGS